MSKKGWKRKLSIVMVGMLLVGTAGANTAAAAEGSGNYEIPSDHRGGVKLTVQ